MCIQICGIYSKNNNYNALLKPCHYTSKPCVQHAPPDEPSISTRSEKGIPLEPSDVVENMESIEAPQ